VAADSQPIIDCPAGTYQILRPLHNVASEDKTRQKPAR